MSKIHFKIKWLLRGLLFAIAFIAFFSLIRYAALELAYAVNFRTGQNYLSAVRQDF